MDNLYDPRFGDADVAACLSEEVRLQSMLDVEAALAESQAALDLIPATAAAVIRACAQEILYAPEEIARDAIRDGNLAIPLVRQLTREVAARDADAARYVHWGATSQDIIDTGLVLQLDAAVPLIVDRLGRAGAAAADLARRHIDVVMPGRTWLQQATPITFGLKAAGWLEALARARDRLASAWSDARVVQFGGATGTLAALGVHGEAVADALAARLGLRRPGMPWHTHRDRLAHVAATLGIAAGSCGKIARDVALLAQTEIAEAHEAPPGTSPSQEHQFAGRGSGERGGPADGSALDVAATRDGGCGDHGRERRGGGSSTMPHKQNPVSASVAIAASVRAPSLVATMLQAMPQEHERGLGTWQAEWQTLPDLVMCCAGGVRATAELLRDLEIDPTRMRANVDATGGLVMAEAVSMALAPRIGKPAAHDLIESACRRAATEQRTLQDVLLADVHVTAHLTPDEIARAVTPEHYLGSARTIVQRVLERYDQRVLERYSPRA
jgi:3-carboxy-cis,cis-muconate cycloisomerase